MEDTPPTEQTQEEQKTLTPQQMFEEELESESMRGLKWKHLPELGLVLHNSDRSAFIKKFHVKSDSTTLEIDRVMDSYNEEVARRLQEGADQEKIKVEAAVYKE